MTTERPRNFRIKRQKEDCSGQTRRGDAAGRSRPEAALVGDPGIDPSSTGASSRGQRVRSGLRARLGRACVQAACVHACKLLFTPSLSRLSPRQRPRPGWAGGRTRAGEGRRGADGYFLVGNDGKSHPSSAGSEPPGATAQLQPGGH